MKRYDNNTSFHISETYTAGIEHYEENKYAIMKRHDLAICEAIHNELCKISPFRDVKILTGETREYYQYHKEGIDVKMITSVFIFWDVV